MNKKIISFSLWGQDPKYTVGAIRNAELASELYPDWTCRFYCANEVPNQIIFQLESFENVQVVNTNKCGSWKFATERFLAIDDDDSEIVIFRDTDSRLNSREQSAVIEWLDSPKTLHIMKDHPYHGNFPILAGMWGLKTSKIKINIEKMLARYNNTEQYHYDQIFLQEFIWPKFKEDFIAHDEFFLKQPFPFSRQGNHYVGKPFNADESVCLPEADVFFREKAG